MRDRSVTIYNYKKEDYPESDYNAILKINTSLNVNNEEDLVEALSSNSPYLLDSSNEVIINKGIVEDKVTNNYLISENNNNIFLEKDIKKNNYISKLKSNYNNYFFFLISLLKYQIIIDPIKLPIIASIIDKSIVLAIPKVIILAIQC